MAKSQARKPDLQRRQVRLRVAMVLAICRWLEKVALFGTKWHHLRLGSKLGNTRMSELRFSKKPVSSILVLGVSIPHHKEGDRHGRPSYVFVFVHAIRPQPRHETAPRPIRGTARRSSLASPGAATPGAAGTSAPDTCSGSTDLTLRAA